MVEEIIEYYNNNYRFYKIVDKRRYLGMLWSTMISLAISIISFLGYLFLYASNLISPGLSNSESIIISIFILIMVFSTTFFGDVIFRRRIEFVDDMNSEYGLNLPYELWRKDLQRYVETELQSYLNTVGINNDVSLYSLLGTLNQRVLREEKVKYKRKNFFVFIAIAIISSIVSLAFSEIYNNQNQLSVFLKSSFDSEYVALITSIIVFTVFVIYVAVKSLDGMFNDIMREFHESYFSRTYEAELSLISTLEKMKISN